MHSLHVVCFLALFWLHFYKLKLETEIWGIPDSSGSIIFINGK